MLETQLSDVADTRHVLLTPVEDGWWMAEVPSLPGCVTQGATKAEALENAREAVQGILAALQDMGAPIPEDKPVEVVVV